MTTASIRSGTIAAVALISGFYVQAQTSPVAAPAPSAKEDVVELSPFVIATERDTGWSANDTLSANRTKQALKDVPVAIDAITRDFMEDLGLDSADDVAQFVAGVWALPIMENDNHKGNFSFRGLAQTNNVSRNYFRWYIPSDTYNVERIDFGKGSNSLIFGEVEPGGQGAVFTKRPLLKNFAEAFAQTNSEGAYRFTFDVNRKLRSNLALRANAVRRLQRTFQDASDYRFSGETISAVWQPFRRTNIRLEYEQGKYQNVRGFAGIWVREQSARSLGFGTAGTYYTSEGRWIISTTLPAADRASANNPSGGSPSLIEGTSFDVKMLNAAGAIVGTKRITGFRKEYNIRGSFDNHSRPFRTWSVTLEQMFGPVATELGYNYQTQQEERNDNAFDQTISVDVNGRAYIDSRGDRKWFRNDVHAFRGSAAYKFDKWKWMEQLFVVGAEYREDQTLNLRWQYFNIAPALTGAPGALPNTTNDRLVLRLYLDDPQFYSRAIFDRMQKDGLPVTSAVNMTALRYFASGTSAADGTAWRQSYSTSISASGRYLKGRLQSLAGARTDWGRTWDYYAARKEGRWAEDIQPPSRADALPGEYLENRALRQCQTTYTGGLTFSLTKDLNLYSIYSESFRFQDARTFDRVTIGPIFGVSKEIGLKGNLWSDKLAFSVGLFEIDRQNVVRSWNNIIAFSDTATEDLMNPNNILPGDSRYKYREPGTASASRNYTATEKSKGVDGTITFRPTRSLQLRFTAGHADVFSRPDLASFRAYYDAAVERTKAAQAPGGNLALAESPALLADAKLLLDTLDIADKPTGARAAPWSTSWVIDYGFARESWQPLRGLRVGVNGSWRDDYLFGIANGQQLIGGSTHLVNAYVMRDQKILGQQVRVRAGIRNLVDLGNSKIRKTGFTTMANGANVYRFSYVMPAQYDLSVTVKF
jgi:hypothetical protein